MKIFDFRMRPPISYGGLIEKIEILRSNLRWAPKLEGPEIQKMLRQCNELQAEVMLLSRNERIRQGPSLQLAPSIRSAAQRRQRLLNSDIIFEGVFGENPKLLETLEIAKKAASTDLPILIEGESGTGKELLAKVIHANGNRSEYPFVSVNCGAIPDSLLESELFGHKRGAYTGASSDRKGKFESANKGTIFLDEVGELPLAGQVALLRVLQSQEIQRVGADEVIELDTRVVAATNRNLRERIQEKRFREDLFYRLGVIHVTLPPLRERQDEIPLLCDYFCDEAAKKLDRHPLKMTSRLRTFLMSYPYPGNIRELRNIIFRMSCLAEEVADLEHLPDAIRPSSPALTDTHEGSVAIGSLSQARKTASDLAEKQFLEKGLYEVKGKVTELARRTGMNRSHLQSLLTKHGLRANDFRARRVSQK